MKKLVICFIIIFISTLCIGQITITGGYFDRRTIKYIPVVFTGKIPICPYCQAPTMRTTDQKSLSFSVHKDPIYDEDGNLTNPDCNEVITFWQCLFCRRDYSIVSDCNGTKYE